MSPQTHSCELGQNSGFQKKRAENDLQLPSLEEQKAWTYPTYSTEPASNYVAVNCGQVDGIDKWENGLITNADQGSRTFEVKLDSGPVKTAVPANQLLRLVQAANSASARVRQINSGQRRVYGAEYGLGDKRSRFKSILLGGAPNVHDAARLVVRFVNLAATGTGYTPAQVEGVVLSKGTKASGARAPFFCPRPENAGLVGALREFYATVWVPAVLDAHRQATAAVGAM